MYQTEFSRKASRTYPGGIKAASPGNVLCYYNRYPRREILPETDRQYWRAVIDDPQQNRREIDVRIRFSTMIWVLSGWERRLHYQIITVPIHATMEHVYHRMIATCEAKWLEMSQLVFLYNGIEISMSSTIEEIMASRSRTLEANLTIDAVEKSYHLEHIQEKQRKNWNEDEITLEDEERLDIKEMHKVPHDYTRPYYKRPHLRY
ncbi:leucine-rich repeat protein [Perkinsela sp. CCAP 1560/4]|nr:leucine-rich repeat protein [Perkinsela sp. CCAP 1560/4]|eukprot:KNH09373.1 leucine-rich repeat protein [Perkinsela sp. CCAP 1560/4]